MRPGCITLESLRRCLTTTITGGVLAAVVIVPLVMTASGCSAIDRYVPPDYDIRGATVIIIPFRQGNYWHYENKEGNHLGQRLEAVMGTDCGGLKSIRNKLIQDEIRKDLRDEIPWLEYGARCEVDFLVVGEIDQLSYENPDLVGMWQGQMRARYEVYDIKAGRLGYARAISVRVPENPDAGEVYIGFEQTKDEIEDALMKAAAKQIAGHLCGYEARGLGR